MKNLVLKTLLLLVIVGTPFALGAQNLEYTPLEPLPGVDQTGQANFADLVKGFFRLLVNVGAFVAVTVLVIGGITYMVSEATVTKLVAREKIKAAFWGLAILAGAWLILNTVNPDLLKFNRNFLNPAPSTQSAVNNSSNSGNPCTPPAGTSDGSVRVSVLSTYVADSACGRQVQAAAASGKTLQNTSLGAIMVGRNSELSSSGAVTMINTFETQCTGTVTRAAASNSTIFICSKNNP